jgi:hypothetical protein
MARVDATLIGQFFTLGSRSAFLRERVGRQTGKDEDAEARSNNEFHFSSPDGVAPSQEYSNVQERATKASESRTHSTDVLRA